MSPILNWMSNMCLLKYMFAEELFSFLPVVGVCHFLKVLDEVSLTQFFKRKQESPYVKISYLQFFKLSYFVIFYQFIKEQIFPAGPRWIWLYLSYLYINTICQFWPMHWCSYFVSKSEMDFLHYLLKKKVQKIGKKNNKC